MIDSNHQLSFLFHRDVQRIFNNFTALFHIRIGFYSPDGVELKVGQERGLCRYCRMIRACPGGTIACLDSDRKGRLKALEKQGLLVYDCHGGMTEAIKPLYREGLLIGYAMIGQIRTRENPPAKKEAAWKAENHNESMAEAFNETPYTRKSDLPRILELFSDLMDLVSNRRLIDTRDADRLTDLTARMKNSPEQNWSLAAAAQVVHLSPSRLSHLIKERFGISLTALVRRFRMDHARFCLTQYPERSIKEIASDIGMGDPRYFSRVFKQETGFSPQEYRNQPNNPHS